MLYIAHDPECITYFLVSVLNVRDHDMCVHIGVSTLTLWFWLGNTNSILFC